MFHAVYGAGAPLIVCEMDSFTLTIKGLEEHDEEAADAERPEAVPAAAAAEGPLELADVELGGAGVELHEHIFPTCLG